MLFFKKEIDAINAFKKIESDFISDDNIIYIAIRKRKKMLFFYTYFVEIGYRHRVLGNLERILSKEDFEAKRFKVRVNREDKFFFQKEYLNVNAELKQTNEFVINVEENIIDNGTNNKEIFKKDKIELRSGMSISNKNEYRGTLGGIFQIQGYENLYFGITNWHVLEYNSEKGLVYFPGNMPDGIQQNNLECGNICWSAIDKFREVAFFQINDDFTKYITKSSTNCGYRLSGKINSAKYNENVIKCGHRTGCFDENRDGECDLKKIYAKHATIKVSDNSYATIGPTERIFREQILVERNAHSGDSGSILVNTNKDAIGLLFALSTDNRYSVANDINYIFHDEQKLKNSKNKTVNILKDGKPIELNIKDLKISNFY